MKSIKAIFRRGHKDGQSHQDNISRTSSVTNLESLEANLQAQQGKGAKPRKVASKERIDKQTQDGKKVTKNNNKLEPPTVQPLSYSSDSLQEAEIQHLKKQLRDMSDEKSSLALQLGEQRGQLNVLQKEIQKLKSFQEDSSLEMDKLADENTVLRNRLRDVAHSPLSDNEKQQLLFESRHHNSAPASIATNVAEDNGGDATTCTTPDWDKHSSSNISEVSVACLQDKINQMQETHYSTNEELQATLQELTDLQRQLTELQQENERLNEEKTLMFDSLCRQTERLNDSRQEVENLKQLLYRDRSDENGINQLESVVEREQKLVELLRSAQEEREQLLLKLEQIQADLQESRSEHIEKAEILAQQAERVRTLEYTLDAKHAEHKQLDQELAQAKDHCSGKQIEINRLTDLLENARTKINELEQDRTLSDKSELDELLDNARKEKDQLESEVAYLKEQLARSKNEIEKLKDQVFVLQEECKVTRNNAKTTQSDLEYKCEKLVIEKNTLGEQLQQFQEAVNELQVQAQCHLEDKRQLSAVLSETQRNLSEAERRNLNLETEIQELKKLRAEENDEWEKFQNDLLTSVRVANDFKTEAQQELQKIILENKTYREKLRLLEGQVEKLKGGKTSTSTQTDVILTPQLISLAKNLDQSITNRLSLLDHSISPTSLGSESPTTPTSSMDRLFPILNRGRRSKSRDNLSDDLSRSSETPIRRSKSKENLNSPNGSRKSSDKIKKPEKSKVKPVTLDQPKKENRGFFQRNKSKDNLEVRNTEEPNAGIMGFLRRNKSKDNLEQFPDVNNEKGKKEEPSRSGISFLKRNKSKDDLSQFAEIDNDTSRKEEASKANTSFLKRTKSKDNLNQLATVDVPWTSSKQDENTIKKETGLVDKPRKSTDSSSSSSKSDFAKPELFSKFIKKRDKKMRSHRKTMSVEEETLLKSLESWYGNIDQNIPDEYLSKEDRAVKQLKVLYEDDQLKERPVAHKPKEQLAISKPLLNSVIRNPKLDEIVRNPHVATVETQVRESALEDTFTLVNEEHEDRTVTDSPRFRLRSEEIYTNIGPKSLGIHKSQSLDDVNVFEEYRTESELAPVLYRAVETDNLATEKHVDIRAGPRHESVFSDIYPNDSVSNPRYSARYYDTHVDYVPNELPKPNIYVNYENLDEIINKVPKDVPESKLTEEQRFALKLKLALFEAEKKNTLKKMNKNKKSIKGLEISEPTIESVQRNWKLKQIMLNPRIKKAEEAKKDKFFLDLFDEPDKKRHSADSSYDMGEIEEIERTSGTISKSYEDISFSFVPENTLMNLHYGRNDQYSRRKKVTSDTSSSSWSFTSAEFNLDTGKIVQKWDIPTELNVKQETVPQKHKADKATEDLLYNETINKEKNKRMHKQKHTSDELESKQQSLDQLKQDLLANKTNSTGEKSQYEEKSDLWVKGSLERYKKDLNQMVKRIDSDQLRESLRRRGLKAANFETDYQVSQTEMVVKEYKISLASPVEVYSVGHPETEERRTNNKQEIWKVQLVDNSDSHNTASHNTTNYPDVEVVGEKLLGSETVDEAINISILYDIISDFILNEKMLSEGYDPNEMHLQKGDAHEPHIKRLSIGREFQNNFSNSDDTENQFHSSNLKDKQHRQSSATGMAKDIFKVTEQSNKHDKKEQSFIVDFINERDSYPVSHELLDRRSLTAEKVEHLGSTLKSNRGTLDLYEISFQTPVEVNTHFEHSKINALNKYQSTDIAELGAVDKSSTSPSDFHFQNAIEVEPHKTAEESVNVLTLYAIIRKFILNERMLSEGYVQREIQKRNSQEPEIKRDFKVNYSNSGNTDNQFQCSKVKENQGLQPLATGIVKDIVEVTKQSHMPHTEELYIVDFVNKNCQVSHKLDDREPTGEEVEHLEGSVKGNIAFDKSNIIVLSKYQSTPDIAELDPVEKTSTNPKDFQFQTPIEVKSHKTADESINVLILYDIISEFILNERILSEGYDPKEINIQKGDSQECEHDLDYHRSLPDEQVEHTDLYHVRYERPVESNTNFETSKVNVFNKDQSTSNIAQMDAAVNSNTSNFHFQIPMEVKPHKAGDDLINVQILYDTIREFILHEKMCSEGYDVRGRYIEKIESQSRMSNLPDHKNDNKRPQIIEDVSYQLPSTRFVATKSDIEEIVNHSLDDNPNITVSDSPVLGPIISNTDQSEILTDQGNLYSSHLVDMATPQSAEIIKEYSYKEILKENQYGVVSPLDLRYTYRGVVKEYKEKYPPELVAEADDNGKGSDVSDLEYNEDFIDEFFKPPTGFEYEFVGPNIENFDLQKIVEPLEIKDQEDLLSEVVDIRKREDAVSQIDKEMQAIMENYIHTRTSLLVKKSGIDLEEKEKNVEVKSNLKKYNNFENLNEIDSSESKINIKEAVALEEIGSKVVFENEDIKCVELDYGEYVADDEPLSLEDLKFIEEMKAKYAPTDNVSIVSNKNAGLPDITEEEIEYKYQHLTDGELDLIRSAKCDRYSRPLSDINERDLLLIDEIAKRYFHDNSLPSSVRNSLGTEKVKDELNATKGNVNVINEAFQIRVNAKKQEEIPPLPLSLPPIPPTEYRDRPYIHSNYEDVDESTSLSFSEKKEPKAEISDSKAVTKRAPEPTFNKNKGYKVTFASPVEVYLGSQNEAGFIQLEDNLQKQNIISGETLENKTVDETMNVLTLKDITKNFIINERKFSDGYSILNQAHVFIQQRNQHKPNTNENSMDRAFRISFTGPADAENQFGILKFKDHDNRVELRNKAVVKDDNVTISNSETDTPNTMGAISKSMLSPSKESEMAHLPPSLRPKKPGTSRPVSYQAHDNVIFTDKNTIFTPQGLLNRPISSADGLSSNRQSSHRLSDLIFRETIFVPLSEDERSKIPRSPLSPGHKQEKELGTWRHHQRPEFKETIVIPGTRKIGSYNVGGLKEIKSSPAHQSPAPKSPAFRETLFIPRRAKEPKERTASTRSTLEHQDSNRSGELSFKETIIIPAKQKLISYSLEKSNTSKDPPKSPQLETQVTVVNKQPEYHSFNETIIVPTLQESPEAKVRNSKTLSLQKSVTQTKNSSRSQVRVNFNRYSAIPKPIVSTTTIRTSERRSLSEPFKLRSLEEGITTYEPVYSNLHFSSNTYKGFMSSGSDIKKKPLPIPRSIESTPQYNEYFAGTGRELHNVKSKNDSFVNMTDSNENFSKILANTENENLKTPNTTSFSQLQAKFSEGAALKEDKEKTLDAPEHTVNKTVIPNVNIPSDQVILTESKAETDIFKNKDKLLVEPTESAGSSRTIEPNEKYDLQNAIKSLSTRMAGFIAKDGESIASGSSSTVRSAASFAVTTKGEQLDITKPKVSADYVLEEDIEDVIRKPSDVEDSNVNLFTMDSHSSYDSYLDLFKSKESKEFDDLRGKKSPTKHFLNMAGFAYVEELVSEDTKSDDIEDEAKPKVIDFVPLDDNTTPFFTKDDNESYDTLEREKTFHVLGQASKMSDVSRDNADILNKEKDNAKFAAEQDNRNERNSDNLESSLEILARNSSSFSKASSKSQTNTSRTSFSQAKKLFEALVEANKDERPKTAVTSPAKYDNARDSRSMDQIRMRDNVSKEGEIPPVAETGLLIKDGDKGPLDDKSENK